MSDRTKNIFNIILYTGYLCQLTAPLYSTLETCPILKAAPSRQIYLVRHMHLVFRVLIQSRYCETCSAQKTTCPVLLVKAFRWTFLSLGICPVPMTVCHCAVICLVPGTYLVERCHLCQLVDHEPCLWSETFPCARKICRYVVPLTCGVVMKIYIMPFSQGPVKITQITLYSNLF